jgi:hypothetical protein
MEGVRVLISDKKVVSQAKNPAPITLQRTAQARFLLWVYRLQWWLKIGVFMLAELVLNRSWVYTPT